jgi:hypothetical protein
MAIEQKEYAAARRSAAKSIFPLANSEQRADNHFAPNAMKPLSRLKARVDDRNKFCKNMVG